MLLRTPQVELGRLDQAPIPVVWVLANKVFPREVRKGQGHISHCLYTERCQSVAGKTAGQLENSHYIKNHTLVHIFGGVFDLGAYLIPFLPDEGLCHEHALKSFFFLFFPHHPIPHPPGPQHALKSI